jgi:hypothetical protein
MKKQDQAEEKVFAKETITGDEITLAADTLVGDLRDAILGRIRNMQKPWEQCNESEQRNIVEQITNAAKHLTTGAVNIIAANGRKTIVCQLGKMEVEKGVIKSKISTKCTEETLLELNEAQDKTIFIIAGDAAAYEGEKAPAEIDPDQPDLERNIKARASKANSSKAA